MPNPASDYENPPVIEVVCGVNFAPLTAFKAVHIGMLWERFKGQFPQTEEHPPVAMVLEQLGIPALPAGSEFQFLESPPLPRIWFLDAAGNGIIQIQRDVFLHNWRKLRETDKYPRFKTVISDYKKHFEVLTEFVAENHLGELFPLQYELNYVNHISESDFWSNGKALSQLLPDFLWRESKARFLPAYESANWKTTFTLPESNGRLHLTLQTAFKKPENKPLLLLELKARGMAKDQSMDAVWKWFDLAHDWIVRGFDDITDNKAQQKLWGRKK